jgi:2-dehydro-3-deoxyphosphogluconate aldolase / (4S)-4-hydroxy-2-oxoglutarate aldolase
MMAKFSRLNVLNTMVETGLVPVFYHAEVEVASNIVQALAEAGVRCFEFTNRGDQAHLVFQELIQRFASDNRVILGAGTIIDPATAALYIQLGANFIVGPVLNPEVAKICNRRKIPYSPGCGSLSEVSAAEELGVEICKVFPGKQVGGPAFVEAMRGPMPWTYIMPTGGVDPTQESITAWFKARVACVGIGSKLVRKDLVNAGDYAEMTRLAKTTLAWIQAARQDYPLFW